MTITHPWHDIVGLAGVAAILVAYALMQAGRLRGESLAYSGINAAGAAAVLVSLHYDFNLSAFIVEAFWVLISLYGVARALRRQAPPIDPSP
jgi:paired small multidrug resistance pump